MRDALLVGGFNNVKISITASQVEDSFKMVYLINYCVHSPGSTTSKKNNHSKVLFPEYELVIETEPDDSAVCDKSEKERLDEYKQFVKSNELISDADSDKELESLATLGKEALLADKQFRKFKKRVAREPKQVCYPVSPHKDIIFNCIF